MRPLAPSYRRRITAAIAASTLFACACKDAEAPETQRRDPPCDNARTVGIRREVQGTSVVLYARVDDIECEGPHIVTQVPIARISRVGRTPECPVGDDLVRRVNGSSFVLLPELLRRLVAAQQREIASVLDGVGRSEERAAFVVGCPSEREVDLLWVDVPDPRDPVAWLSNPAHSERSVVRFVREHREARECDDPPPTTTPCASMVPSSDRAPSAERAAEAGADSAWDSDPNAPLPPGERVDPPTCRLPPVEPGWKRFVSRDLAMGFLSSPTSKTTRVLDTRGDRFALRQFEEAGDRGSASLRDWHCVRERVLVGKVEARKGRLALRGANEEAFGCRWVTMPVANANAMLFDGGADPRQEGCELWRWQKPPRGSEKVLVCGEAIFGEGTGVEQPRAQSMCSGATLVRRIDPSGRVFPFDPASAGRANAAP